MDIESDEFKNHVKRIKEVRMKELSAIIQSSGKSNLLEKFGVALLYNQMIEYTLKNLIIISKVKNNISSDTDMDRYTFGKLIKEMDSYMIKLENYDELRAVLQECLLHRNTLVHNIFEIEYFFDIVEILEIYIENEEKTIKLLDWYWIELENSI